MCPTLTIVSNQIKALPLALKGKDIIAKARTGSGKTGAYAIPILQKILDFEGFNKRTQAQRTGPSAVVLVPSRELVEQVRQVFSALAYFAPSVNVAALTIDQPIEAQKAVCRTQLSAFLAVSLHLPTAGAHYL